MTVRRGLEVLGLLEAERLDDDTGAEVEVLADDLHKLLVRLLARAVGVNVDRQGLGNTNSVRELDERAARKTGRNKRLGCMTPCPSESG